MEATSGRLTCLVGKQRSYEHGAPVIVVGYLGILPMLWGDHWSRRLTVRSTASPGRL